MHKVGITIDGEHISMDTFMSAVTNFLSVLREVDQAVSRKPAVRWRLAELHYGSPATVACIGEPRSKKVRRESVTIVVDTVLTGLSKLETDRTAGRPAGFTDDALEAAKRLVEVRGKGGINTLIFTSTDTDHIEGLKKLELTQRAAATVDDLVAGKFRAIGSVEGTLQLLSTHTTPYFAIYDDVWGGRVRCEFPDKLKSLALNAFDQRVVVRGTVTSDVAGRPRHVKVDDLVVLPAREQLPQSLRGADRDFTGPLDAGEYIRRRWA
jgi:hypothetical protein